MDRDRPSFGIGLDALREVTAVGFGPTSAGAENSVKVGGGSIDVDAQEALERVSEVLRPDRSPVREADAPAELEDVRLSIRARLRNLSGKVGHERRTADPANSPIREEPIVRQRGHQP